GTKKSTVNPAAGGRPTASSPIPFANRSSFFVGDLASKAKATLLDSDNFHDILPRNASHVSEPPSESGEVSGSPYCRVTFSGPARSYVYVQSGQWTLGLWPAAPIRYMAALAPPKKHCVLFAA